MPVGDLKIRSNLRDYAVSFADSADFINALAAKPNVLFVVDQMVWQYHGEGVLKPLREKDHILVDICEERKTLSAVQELYDQIIQRSPKKNITMVSIGGGILQDITGFVASTLYRGIGWIFVPTTLLSQADSCIGAKTSLNYHSFKNLIGTFYPPSQAIVHPPFLKTQQEVDFLSGLGEMMKLHLMGGKDLAEEFKNNLPCFFKRDMEALAKGIKSSLSVKQSYIEEDEFDAGRRNLLNFGHCFGHAIETATDYLIPHGQAIAMGILIANFVSLKRGLLLSETSVKLGQDLIWPIIDQSFRKTGLDADKIIRAMQKDKKRVGAGLALVMIKEGYQFIKVDDLSESEARQALDLFREKLARG